MSTLAEARDVVVATIRTARTTELASRADQAIDQLLLAHTRHLAQGEGLDLKLAVKESFADSDSMEPFKVNARAFKALDQQHRARCGALRAELAASQARVRELEECARHVATMAHVPGKCAACAEIRRLNEEAQ